MQLPDLLLTATLGIEPLVASGVALLREDAQSEEGRAATHG